MPPSELNPSRVMESLTSKNIDWVFSPVFGLPMNGDMYCAPLCPASFTPHGVRFTLCLSLNPSVGGEMGCIRDCPLWVSNLGSLEILCRQPPFRICCQHPHFAGPLDSQVPNRMNILGDLVLLGLLSKLGSGNCWSQTTPLQRDSRGSPRPGWG